MSDSVTSLEATKTSLEDENLKLTNQNLFDYVKIEELQSELFNKSKDIESLYKCKLEMEVKIEEASQVSTNKITIKLVL